MTWHDERSESMSAAEDAVKDQARQCAGSSIEHGESHTWKAKPSQAAY